MAKIISSEAKQTNLRIRPGLKAQSELAAEALHISLPTYLQLALLKENERVLNGIPIVDPTAERIEREVAAIRIAASRVLSEFEGRGSVSKKAISELQDALKPEIGGAIAKKLIQKEDEKLVEELLSSDRSLAVA